MKVQDAQPAVTGTLNNKQAELQKGASEARGTGTEEKAAAPASTRVEISEQSKGAQKAAEIAQQTPEVRLEKIERLKEQIEAGEYNVDSSKVADKMLRHLLSDLIR